MPPRSALGKASNLGDLNGSCGQVPSLAAIDPDAPLLYESLTQNKTDGGNRTGSFCHPCFLRSKWGRSKDLGVASRRCHSLGTKTFWSIRPRLKSTKNWSPDDIRGSRLHFEWIASGFTAVCFWTAPVVPPRAGIRTLEGPVRFRLELHTGPIESE